MTKIEQKLLHYTGKAISVYNMVQKDDRILICLSGGKDSFGLVKLLHWLQKKAKLNFYLHILVVDQKLPNWNRQEIESWLEEKQLNFTILDTNIFNIVKAKKRKNDPACILCSRLRRGHIYTFAKKNGFNKLALGHHRDDLITSLLMSIFYNGTISSMPPKLVTTDKSLIVIRPLIYCQEKDILQYALEQKFPLSAKEICKSQEGRARKNTQQLIQQLASSNSKIPANILHALGEVRVSQLMDLKWWDFKNLEKTLQ